MLFPHLCNRRVELYHQAMYESIRVHEPRPSDSSTSATPTPQSSPTLAAPPPNTSPIHAANDADFDLVDDFDDFSLDFNFIDADPRAVLVPRSMAADFSEGRLETFVGKPQKELPGTKDAYVSYLVTTKVGT